MNCSRKSSTEYIISHAECTSTNNPTRQGNPFRGAVGDLDRSNCSAQSSTGRNASIPPNLPFYLMDYLVINVQFVIAIYGKKLYNLLLCIIEICFPRFLRCFSDVSLYHLSSDMDFGTTLPETYYQILEISVSEVHTLLPH